MEEKYGLTKIERLLIYGLSQFPISEEDQEAIFLFLKEEDDKLLMIYYLKTHPDATPQDILNESGRLLKQRQRFNEEANK